MVIIPGTTMVYTLGQNNCRRNYSELETPALDSKLNLYKGYRTDIHSSVHATMPYVS